MTADRAWMLAGLVAGVCGLASGCAPKAAAPLTDLPPIVVGSISDQVDLPVPPAPRRQGAGRAVPADWTPKGHRPWRYIVIHHSASNRGNAAIFDKWHRGRGWDSLGYHFVITNGTGGADGNVEVGGRWRTQKWGAHCGGTPGNEYNNHGIGICLVGDFVERMPSEAQLASLRRLVLFLMRRYGIDPARIVAHCDAPKADTACPGKVFLRHLKAAFIPALNPDS